MINESKENSEKKILNLLDTARHAVSMREVSQVSDIIDLIEEIVRDMPPIHDPASQISTQSGTTQMTKETKPIHLSPLKKWWRDLHATRPAKAIPSRKSNIEVTPEMAYAAAEALCDANLISPVCNPARIDKYLVPIIEAALDAMPPENRHASANMLWLLKSSVDEYDLFRGIVIRAKSELEAREFAKKFSLRYKDSHFLRVWDTADCIELTSDGESDVILAAFY